VRGTAHVTELRAICGKVAVNGERKFNLQELAVLVPLHVTTELEPRTDRIERHVLFHVTILPEFVLELHADTQRT